MIEETTAINQKEIAALLEKIEPHFEGYNRLTILLACVRIISAMLAAAPEGTRERTLQEMPDLMRTQIKYLIEQMELAERVQGHLGGKIVS